MALNPVTARFARPEGSFLFDLEDSVAWVARVVVAGPDRVLTAAREEGRVALAGAAGWCFAGAGVELLVFRTFLERVRAAGPS